MKEMNTNEGKALVAELYKITHGKYPSWYQKLLDENDGKLPDGTRTHEQSVKRLIEFRTNQARRK